MIAHRWLWTGIAVTAAAIAAGAALLTRSDTAQISLPEVTAPEISAVDAADTPLQVNAAEDEMPHLPDTAYLIRLSGDVLTVYAEGNGEPCAQYTLPADWLPAYDRTLLEYGLRAENADELRDLVEDYLS